MQHKGIQNNKYNKITIIMIKIIIIIQLNIVIHSSTKYIIMLNYQNENK
jgi:hypothetical protein